VRKNVVDMELLRRVKSHDWFYEFSLPDGTKTSADVGQEVGLIHTTRRDKLREVIATEVPNSKELAALDFASHQGYFSVELSKHFRKVTGLELRPQSIVQARDMTSLLGICNVEYQERNLLELKPDERLQADFVLLYGLLYHLEEPIRVLRLASQLTRQHILIETQVFPYDISGRIEDGSYAWQRAVAGVFSLSVDYGKRREGGNSDLAIIPSVNALLFLLTHFGFSKVRIIETAPTDYEQFRRGSRVIIYGAKT
jgi:tRNA (mo5U34)-methyltransferase